MSNIIKENYVQEGESDKILFNFVNGGVQVEVHGHSKNTYKITLTDIETNKKHVEYENVPTGELRLYDVQYYVKWNIVVTNEQTNEIAKEYTIDLKDKNVLITFETSALGDSIAFFDYIEQFRKKHSCNIICSSFHNYLFEDTYSNIQFVKRGQPVKGAHYHYKLGWFGSGHASNLNPNTCHTIPLQKVASDILGLDYKEAKPSIVLDNRGRKIPEKYVVITTCSTAQFKFWNRPNGWQELVSSLSKKGYKTVVVGKQPNYLKGVYNFTGKKEMIDLINVMQHSEFFIGLPSGLAWLAWGLNKKSVMITGISEAYCEYRLDNYRVENKKVCNGCFNDPNHVFEKSNWMYCPRHQNTPRHFECTKTIEPKDVMLKVQKLINDLKTGDEYYSMSDQECNDYIASLDLIR